MFSVFSRACIAVVFFPTLAFAGATEERFVGEVVASMLQSASPGSGRSEVQRMLRLLQQNVDADHVAEQSFGAHFEGLSSQQKSAAATSILSGSATMLAAALEGTERVEIQGSESMGGDTSIVETILSAPVDGLRDGILVTWTVDRDFGLLKLLDINVGGRSAVLVQSEHIDQLFAISQGNLDAVLAGMSEFGQQ